MIARRLEWRVDAAEDAAAAVADFGELAVHHLWRAHDLAAEGLADGLMPETDAEDRNGGRRLGDKFEADAGLVRCARPGREHDRLRRERHHRLGRDLVVAMDDDIGPQPGEIMHQVEGEA